MKRWSIPLPIVGALISIVAILGLYSVSAADVDPEEFDVDFNRGSAPLFNTRAFFEGTTLRIEFQCFSDDDGVVTQDLTNVTLEFRLGTASTNVPYVPTVTNATAGQGYVDVGIPYLTNITGSLIGQLQLTGTNDGGVVYIYPQGSLARQTPLQ